MPYVQFLNQLGSEVHLESVEAFWVHRVRDFFAGQPLRIKLDPGMGIQAVVRDLMNQAAKRELVHVTTSPGEAVIRRCAENLEAGLRPVLVVRGRSVGTATDLANNAGIEDRVDVLSVEQLVTLAVIGSRALGVRERRDALSQIVERYKDIVGEVETDPSLTIALS